MALRKSTICQSKNDFYTQEVTLSNSAAYCRF